MHPSEEGREQATTVLTFSRVVHPKAILPLVQQQQQHRSLPGSPPSWRVQGHPFENDDNNNNNNIKTEETSEILFHSSSPSEDLL